MEEPGYNDSREEIFSKAIRAGKRTYFFDVKATRSNEYYLTVTESKRRFGAEGDKPSYEKHKIFLYQEDFEKFMDGLREALNFISESEEGQQEPRNDAEGKTPYSDVDFEDLEGEK